MHERPHGLAAWRIIPHRAGAPQACGFSPAQNGPRRQKGGAAARSFQTESRSGRPNRKKNGESNPNRAGTRTGRPEAQGAKPAGVRRYKSSGPAIVISNSNQERAAARRNRSFRPYRKREDGADSPNRAGTRTGRPEAQGAKPAGVRRYKSSGPAIVISNSNQERAAARRNRSSRPELRFKPAKPPRMLCSGRKAARTAPAGQATYPADRPKTRHSQKQAGAARRPWLSYSSIFE